MATCEFEGCPNAATDAVPTVWWPSKVPFDHPDYRPPKTTIHACAEHRWIAKIFAEIAEIETLDD